MGSAELKHARRACTHGHVIITTPPFFLSFSALACVVALLRPVEEESSPNQPPQFILSGDGDFLFKTFVQASFSVVLKYGISMTSFLMFDRMGSDKVKMHGDTAFEGELQCSIEKYIPIVMGLLPITIFDKQF